MASRNVASGEMNSVLEIPYPRDEDRLQDPAPLEGGSSSVAMTRRGPEMGSSQLTSVSASAHLAVRPRILPAGKWPLHGHQRVHPVPIRVPSRQARVCEHIWELQVSDQQEVQPGLRAQRGWHSLCGSSGLFRWVSFCSL
ncbi:cartilage acidic protein 1 [Phyllostomus discolor]|nr:cartilage acidic protein 1 [Phyllostomus discolor]